MDDAPYTRLVKQFDGQVEFWLNQNLSHQRIVAEIAKRFSSEDPMWPQIVRVSLGMEDEAEIYRDYLRARDLWDEEANVPRKVADNPNRRKDAENDRKTQSR